MPIAACASCPGAAKRRFPIPKNQERGPLRVRFSRVRRAASCRAQAAHIPLWDRVPPAPALFVCGHFCHFPVHSCLRDMGPAQPNKALSHPKKLRTRAAKGPFSPRSGGRQAAAAKPRTSRCGTGPSCARAFHLQPFLSFPGPQPPARRGAGAAGCIFWEFVV